LSAASESAFTRVSLYFHVVPGFARTRVSHSPDLSVGRSALREQAPETTQK
jgi:hypothetical protein